MKFDVAKSIAVFGICVAMVLSVYGDPGFGLLSIIVGGLISWGIIST